MKKIICSICFSFIFFCVQAQTCQDLIDYVKQEDYGSSYYSPSSSSINRVSFHSVTDEDWVTHYFAIVQFTSSYEEYIYSVPYSSRLNYSLNYLDSAGKAFQEFIQPYRNNLACSP